MCFYCCHCESLYVTSRHFASLCVTSRHFRLKSQEKSQVNMSCPCHVGVLGVPEVGGWYVRPEVGGWYVRPEVVEFFFGSGC